MQPGWNFPATPRLKKNIERAWWKYFCSTARLPVYIREGCERGSVISTGGRMKRRGRCEGAVTMTLQGVHSSVKRRETREV
ncbi:hypothetical protein GDO81_016291 [Engystomops pustulosus]|uniref:Uncharacterized protein n=1 Tax=Engystomops pustulosus TaxID=76066 RepID=A0AAV7AR28_ENGPU|nr:hypothetical protein GDO81_016291 [Engystomops pustulosus]